MKRIGAVLLVLAVLAGVLGCCCAAAEEIPLATATDLCPHEHVKEVFYFDHPDYRATNRYVHTVSGSAVVETICEDCGEVLSSEWREKAEELRQHTYSKSGVCRLCGYVRPDQRGPEKVLKPEAGEDGSWSLTVTKADTAAFEAGTEVLVFRAEGSAVALAVRLSPAVNDVLALGPLTADLRPEKEEDAYTAALRAGENGAGELPAEDCSLRLYEACETLSVAFIGEDGVPAAAEAIWNEPVAGAEGYWSVAWMGDGSYLFEK